MKQAEKITRIAIEEKAIERMKGEIKAAEKWTHEGAEKFIKDRYIQIALARLSIDIIRSK